jgi:hypothetical protein
MDIIHQQEVHFYENLIMENVKILGNELYVPYILTGRRPLCSAITLSFLAMQHVNCIEEDENKLMGSGSRFPASQSMCPHLLETCV